MTALLSRLIRSTGAASAAEFALVLPLLLLFLFGIVDAGRFAWEYNRAEKATQMGARFATVTDPVAPGLFAFDFSGAGIAQGNQIPAASMATVTCTSTTCTCAQTGTCTGTGTPTGAWAQLLARMRQIDPQIAATNLRVQYQGSGVGYAGDPTGMDAVPIVTVSLTNMQFRPITCIVFACSINMPDFHTSLTAEDAVGSQSN